METIYIKNKTISKETLAISAQNGIPNETLTAKVF